MKILLAWLIGFSIFAAIGMSDMRNQIDELKQQLRICKQLQTKAMGSLRYCVDVSEECMIQRDGFLEKLNEQPIGKASNDFAKK